MKALILAAGLGTRLAPLTDNCPKSLIQVNGKAILEKQIENLLENGIEDITIISGYKSNILKEFVDKKFSNVKTIKLIDNVDYSTTNNMYSAYLAKDSFKNSEFLMMNADVFFDSSVLKNLIDFEADNAIVVDIGNYMEESMKVVNDHGKLVKISKQIPLEEAYGCSIDVYKFSKEGGEAFFRKCSEYIEEKKELQLWSEVALNDVLAEVDFKACPLVGRWFEIDNHEDLENAKELFKN